MVKYNLTVTINLSNFNSCKIGVSDCDNIEEVYLKMKDFLICQIWKTKNQTYKDKLILMLENFSNEVHENG